MAFCPRYYINSLSAVSHRSGVIFVINNSSADRGGDLLHRVENKVNLSQ